MIIAKLNKERLGIRKLPPVVVKKPPAVDEKEDSPLPVKEEIPVIVEEPEPPKAEVPEEEDSKDWFNADEIEYKKEEEEPEMMWFVPVDTYTGGFAAVLENAALEARDQKVKKSELE